MRWVVFLLWVLLAACGDRDVAKLAAVKQQVCACKDVACAEAAMKSVPQGDVKPTHREQGIARDMLDCLAKLYDAEKPAAPAE